MLHRLARRGPGAAVLAFGGAAGAVVPAPAALVERTFTLIPRGVAVPNSIHALME